MVQPSSSNTGGCLATCIETFGCRQKITYLLEMRVGSMWTKEPKKISEGSFKRGGKVDPKKCNEVAQKLMRLYPKLVISIVMEKRAIPEPIIRITGVGEGYRYAIRVKISDFERNTVATIVEAFDDKLRELRNGKDGLARR